MSKPTISINKLGEYITAGASRRKSIVQDQKEPPKFLVARYTEAKLAYANYFASGFQPGEILTLKADLEKRRFIHATDFKENDRVTSIEALECYNKLVLPSFDGLTFYLNKGGILEIAGVEISVNPNVICRGVYKGQESVGAIKLHIAKSSLKDEAQKIIATILHQYVEEALVSDGEDAPLDLAISLDIFSRKLVAAPAAIKKRRAEIQAACEEYAFRWEKM